ncbi:PREDICTED: mitogen-activated protein kinase kinase 7-like [Camelina sativa]|uniref:Mitogen-activated protein kinase kinase 7-like n=1 Tax=Camelina sativa TaxID=90675 RepID=A0ABM0T0N9_CAMSA|nr:PREDICTED: mitogen-activated protein kinase kinase 7-like [Camelina sativa]
MEITSNKRKRVVAAPPTNKSSSESSVQIISQRAFEAAVYKLSKSFEVVASPTCVIASPQTYSDQFGSSIKVISREAFEASVSKRSKTEQSPDGSVWIHCHSLGEGAHGFVYLAKQNTDVETDGLPLKMAIKCSSITFSSSLIDEEQILTRLSSPYVISCYGSKITMSKTRPNGSDYNLILEYCSGGRIADFLKFRGKGMVENDVQLFSTDILKGISYIHSMKIIHCDIKPGNILLKPQVTRSMSNGFEPKIADFGLALRKTSDEYGDGSGHKRGTLLYMSPEVLREGLLDYAADIWSFGCTVLEMLTGKKPWSEFQVLDRKKLEDVIAHSSFKPCIPSWLFDDAKDFLNKCLEIDPLQRFDSTALLKHKFLSSCNVDDNVVKKG